MITAPLGTRQNYWKMRMVKRQKIRHNIIKRKMIKFLISSTALFNFIPVRYVF